MSNKKSTSQKRSRTTEVSQCIHCKKCTDNCLFLRKYEIDIGTTKRLKELAYHCYLCGRCTQVCPVGIDGREVILSYRRAEIKNNCGKLKGYRFLRIEKENYIFKNYKHAHKRSVIFPGCNFPSFYPKTMDALLGLFNEYQDTGIAYDCCGKPIAELGLGEKADQIIERINQRLQDNHVEEVIMVCPNCYYYLEPKFSVKVIYVYDKLAQLGFSGSLSGEGMNLFIPCPDRESRDLRQQLLAFVDGEPKDISQIQCCGLGGCAAAKEQELSRELLSLFANKEYEAIYTYCGTCGGNISKSEAKHVRHVLPELLGTHEVADIKHSLTNRAKTRFK